MLRAEPVASDAVDANDLIHRSLARANAARFAPLRTAGDFDAELEREAAMRRSERTFVEAERAAVKAKAQGAPNTPQTFMAWLESLAALQSSGAEPLLAALGQADAEQVHWFMAQERARRIGFELSQTFTARPVPWEALAVSNLMNALSSERHYAYQSLGARGFVECTTLERLPRLDAVCARKNIRFPSALRDGLEPARFQCWQSDELFPLLESDASFSSLIAEGVLMCLRAITRADQRCLHELANGSQLVARFEYADESALYEPEPAFAVPRAPAVRPVQWRDVSARHS